MVPDGGGPRVVDRVITTNSRETTVSTILAYTSPAAGHLFPLMPGLIALRDRGHDVVVITEDAFVDTVTDEGIAARAVSPEVAGIVPRDYEVKSPRERLHRGVQTLIGRGEHEIPDLRAAIAEHDPDLLLIDINAYGAAIAATVSGLPWMMIMPTLLPLPGAGIPPYGLGLKPMGGPIGRLRDRVLTQQVMRMFSRAMCPGINRLRAAEGLPPLDAVTDHMLSSDEMLVLTGDPLEYPRTDLPPGITFAGAQNWSPPADTPDWLLEDGDPWVLVTCSTDYQGDEALAAAAIEALRDEPVRVVVTLGDAAQGAASLPLADNARVERFVPHDAILERAAVVVAHGGMGIVQKTIAAGVPLVVVPFGRDQPEVARRVEQAGAGVILPTKRLSSGTLNDAFRAALALPDVARASARLRAHGGGDRVADAIEARLPAAVAA